ncbi:unnamed protein product [Durusdinium trenchii]|uniref:Cilia- and flagella-associated protein 157 n=1 Tax=Durusdinium trenchii TaxID=1381693 RepID=A0ABP0ME09_9DINO
MEHEDVSQLRKERALLLGELSTLRAKFELTLQTLRALLGLELSCTWADIVEHVELLTRVADGRKGKEPPDAEEREVEELQQLLLNAEMDLDEKEKQLEEQQNRVQSLSNVLAKQQNVLDMTAAQLSNQQEQKDMVSRQSEQLVALTVERDRLRDDRDRLRHEAEQLRELSHVQQRRLQEKESQLSSAEASLATNQQALFRREKELGALQADHQRQQVEIEELCEAVTWRDNEVEHIRSQLEVFEVGRRAHLKVHTPAGGRASKAQLSFRKQHFLGPCGVSQKLGWLRAKFIDRLSATQCARRAQAGVQRALDTRGGAHGGQPHIEPPCITPSGTLGVNGQRGTRCVSLPFPNGFTHREAPPAPD